MDLMFPFYGVTKRLEETEIEKVEEQVLDGIQKNSADFSNLDYLRHWLQVTDTMFVAVKTMSIEELQLHMNFFKKLQERAKPFGVTFQFHSLGNNLYCQITRQTQPESAEWHNVHVESPWWVG